VLPTKVVLARVPLVHIKLQKEFQKHRDKTKREIVGLLTLYKRGYQDRTKHTFYMFRHVSDLFILLSALNAVRPYKHISLYQRNKDAVNTIGSDNPIHAIVISDRQSWEGPKRP
jgi:hypothetical protein